MNKVYDIKSNENKTSNKMSDKSDKMSSKGGKTSEKSDKTSDKSNKTSDKSNKTSDKSNKTSEKSDKTSDKSNKTNDKISGKNKSDSEPRKPRLLSYHPGHTCTNAECEPSSEIDLTAQPDPPNTTQNLLTCGGIVLRQLHMHIFLSDECLDDLIITQLYRTCYSRSTQ